MTLIAQNKLKAEVDLGEQNPEGRFFGLESTFRAEDWLHSGQSQGKVVVKVNDF